VIRWWFGIVSWSPCSRLQELPEIRFINRAYLPGMEWYAQLPPVFCLLFNYLKDNPAKDEK